MSNHERFFWALGVLGMPWLFYLYVEGLDKLRNGSDEITQVTYFVGISLVVILSLSVLEIFFRNQIKSTLISALKTKKIPKDDTSVIDSVHYTRSIERVTWSATDIVRDIAPIWVALGGVIIAVKSQIYIPVLFFLLLAVTISLQVRRLLILRRQAKVASEEITKQLSESNRKSIAVADLNSKIQPTILHLAEVRGKIMILKSIISLTSLISGIALLIFGIYAGSNSEVGGVLVILGLFTMDSLNRLIESLTVHLSERIHLETLLHISNTKGKT